MASSKKVETTIYSIYVLSRSLLNPKVILLVEMLLISVQDMNWGARWHRWLRHCASSRKVTGSVPDQGNRDFHCVLPAPLWHWGILSL